MRKSLVTVGYVMQRFIFLIFLAVSVSGNVKAGMEYVEVCNQKGECRKLSRLVMGTDHLIQGDWTKTGQPELTQKEVWEVLDEAVRLGINVFDTAPIYVGGVENSLGKWMAQRQKIIRENHFFSDKTLNPDRQLYALSKGGFPFDLYYSKKLEPGTHSKELLEALSKAGVLSHDPVVASDGSILLNTVPPGTYASRLYGDKSQITARVAEELGHSVANLHDFLTIYLMHRDDGDALKFNRVGREQTPVRTIMEALGRLPANYWMLGWSNWETARVTESIDLAAKDSKLPKPGFNSAYFSLFEMSPRSIHALGVQITHDEMNDPSFQKGILQNPYSPLGGFSILDKAEPTWENAMKSAREKFESRDPYWQNVYPSIFTAANKARFQRAVRFTGQFNRENRTNYTVDQMVNAYALAHKRTDFLTVGPVTIAQLRRTVKAIELSHRLTSENLDYLHSGKGSSKCKGAVEVLIK